MIYFENTHVNIPPIGTLQKQPLWVTPAHPFCGTAIHLHSLRGLLFKVQRVCLLCYYSRTLGDTGVLNK